jgi:multidrug efflux pump subunit AcrA (membrane-fusion protein)
MDFYLAKGNTMTSAKLVTVVVVLSVIGAAVLTQRRLGALEDEKPGAKPAESSKQPGNTYKVEKKPFRIELAIKGILEAEVATEILYRPQPMVNPPPTQGPLTIRTILEHGTHVKTGDLLAALDTRKLDAVIADVKVEKKVLEASIKLAEKEVPPFEKSIPVDLAAAVEADKHAREDLQYFNDVGRPYTEKQAHFMVKSAAFYLEYAKEELAQLEKMYKSNDLTEDTEKIILKRQRNAVEMAAFYLRAEEIYRDQILKITLPRKELSLKENVTKQAISLEKARTTLAPMLIQKQQALVRLRHDLDKTSDRLTKLEQDRAAMTIRAPFDGIAYHGKFHKGQWTLPASLEGKLAANGTISPEEVFLTVIKHRPLYLRLTVEEKDAYLVKPGLQGKAKVLFNPDSKVSATVRKISPLPSAPGQFEAVVALGLDEGNEALLPGMACSVKFVPYAKKDAVAVPAAAVYEEDDRYFVQVVHKNGKREERAVTPGRTFKEQTEIVSGLRAGEQISLDRSQDTKTASLEKGLNP